MNLNPKNVAAAKELTGDLLTYLFDELRRRNLKDKPEAAPPTLIGNMLLHIIFYGNGKDPNDYEEFYVSLCEKLMTTMEEIDNEIEKVLR